MKHWLDYITEELGMTLEVFNRLSLGAREECFQEFMQGRNSLVVSLGS